MLQSMNIKPRIRKGDLVVVIAGKDKGKQGKITRVIREENRVAVDGINMVTRHLRPSQKNPQGGRTTKEAPIHISNVMLVDPKTGKPTRILRKPMPDPKTGKIRIVRVTKDSGTELN